MNVLRFYGLWRYSICSDTERISRKGHFYTWSEEKMKTIHLALRRLSNNSKPNLISITNYNGWYLITGSLSVTGKRKGRSNRPWFLSILQLFAGVIQIKCLYLKCSCDILLRYTFKIPKYCGLFLG